MMGSFGKRSPMPFTTQLVRCSTLYQVKPSACTERKRLQLLNIGSPQFGPEWNDSTRPRSSMARYTFMRALSLTAMWERTVVNDNALMKVYRAIEERSEEHTSELQSRQYLVCR